MKLFRIRRAVLVLAVPFTFLVLVNSLHQMGIRINISASEPMGIYLMKAFRQNFVIERNSLIAFCPMVSPKNFPFVLKGDCPNGAAPFLKHVIGLPGDTVEETDEGVWINGQAVKDSKPKDRSMVYHVELPRWRGQKTLDKDEYWVYGSGDPTDSFDSRYFGPVEAIQIVSISNGKATNRKDS